MRNTFLMLIAVLLLGPRLAMAQAQPAPQAPAASPVRGTVDVGGLFSTTDGDAARFERYRDARDGLYSSFAVNRDGGSYLFDAFASHIGYRDQKYGLTLFGSKINFNFDWTSVPLNLVTRK